MNKRGELITLSIIVLLLILFGFIYIEGRLGKNDAKMKYVGDASIGIAYNIQSENKDCNLGNILIEKNNVKYFKDLTEVSNAQFRIDDNCY